MTNAVVRSIARVLCATTLVAGWAIASSVPPARATVTAPFPSDIEIRKLLAHRVDTVAGQDDGVGIVVGVLEPAGRRIVAYGHRDRGDQRPLDGNSCFEIGSVTKVFTALVLADMVVKGEVGLDDLVAKYLPAGARIPERNGHPITLADLATHTAGLPFMPDDPSAGHDATTSGEAAARFYRFLARYEPPDSSGDRWEYSNLGYWLLSQALASRAGLDYQALLQTRIIGPLRLRNTALQPTALMKGNMVVGHDAALERAPVFSEVPIYRHMPAAGGLISTVDDMLTFLSVSMGSQSSALSPAMAVMLRTRRPIRPGELQALGWVLIGDDDDQLIVHDGATWGYASSVAWDPRRKVGVVVLSNELSGVEDIARHLLRPSVPLANRARTKHTEIVVDAARLDKYAGRYEVPGEGVFTLVREGQFLIIQAPGDWGLPRLRLRAESLRDFFTVELPLRVTVDTDADGNGTELLVYPPRGQHVVRARRVK